MADRIVIPTRMVGGQVKYVCKIDACALESSEEGRGRLLDSSGRLHGHLMMQHGRRCANPTQIYHACADPECREQLFDADHMMETHIRAVHPHLLNGGQPVLYSAAAKQARARLEALVTEECIG
ncbi:uncharacterized protein LOC129602148 [Paramacrobiotus metropolitanus]|uniref:uncharacterized protein LOC129602148 n=1 Tax=Paramacrobiotus metropolitanus TaxID=2943436 RepID=UPI0024465B36|nr:uncharacterized protein LOC129602148 [Paramacrobiotus metropolitanus]